MTTHFKKYFNYFRDNFITRYAQYILFYAFLGFTFFALISITGPKPAWPSIAQKILPAMGILILGYNKEYDCKFALTSIRKRPPYLNDDLSVWEGKTISISVHPELLKKKPGSTLNKKP